MPERVKVEQAVQAYMDYFTGLTPETVGRIDRLAVPDVHFKDPFNDFRDRARLRRMYERMFKRLDQPRFFVRDRAISGQTAYLRWTFTFRTRFGGPRPWAVEGVSEVRFDHAGHVVSHFDHWDAAEQVYEKLPGLGWMLRQVKRRLAGRMAD